jgi:hypothetical protein
MLRLCRFASWTREADAWLFEWGVASLRLRTAGAPAEQFRSLEHSPSRLPNEGRCLFTLNVVTREDQYEE